VTAKVPFKQDDVTRAVRGCIAGGMAVGTVRILPGGAIEVYAARIEGHPSPQGNTLDRLLDEKTT